MLGTANKGRKKNAAQSVCQQILLSLPEDPGVLANPSSLVPVHGLQGTAQCGESGRLANSWFVHCF